MVPRGQVRRSWWGDVVRAREARREAELFVDDLPRLAGGVQDPGLKDAVPERPYHSNLCTSEFH